MRAADPNQGRSRAATAVTDQRAIILLGSLILLSVVLVVRAGAMLLNLT